MIVSMDGGVAVGSLILRTIPFVHIRSSKNRWMWEGC